jgi:prepilin-type N-terminal cleavage/methylation domain-containing protein
MTNNTLTRKLRNLSTCCNPMFSLKRPRNSGFTIVELLIVIVVIAILATIVIVAYNGIQQRAHSATIANVTNGSYPIDLASAGFKAGSTVYTYYYNSSGNTYCLSGTNTGTSYSINSSNNAPQNGDCTTNGLVGWWPMNGNTNDISGNGNNGVVTGATLTIGKNGSANGAYSFNGASYIQLPSAVDTQPSISLSAWGFPTNFGSNEGVYIIAADPGPRMLISPSGVFTASVNTTTASWQGVASVSAIALNQWSYFTYVIDSTSLKLYVNGSLTASATISGSTINYNSTTPLVIGSDNYTANPYHEGFIGTIDHARIYNRALSATEIQSIYTAGAQ